MSSATNGTTNGAGSMPKNRGIYLLTHPRTCSNLFMRMMGKQPVRQQEYYFLEACGMAQSELVKGPLKNLPESEQEAMYARYREGFARMEDDLLSAEEEGVSLFIKEHVSFMSPPDKMFKFMWPGDDLPQLQLESKLGFKKHTNPTLVPDEVMLSMQPVFLIRHPIRMLPSMVRVQQESGFKSKDFKVRNDYFLTLNAQRALYDWYLGQKDAPRPRIIDADDIMTDPAVVRAFCTQVGLDPSAVAYEWDEGKADDNPIKKVFLDRVNNSTGILPGLDAKGLSVDEECVKWREQFGEENADDLAAMVRGAMPNYEYFCERRVTSPESAAR